MNSQKAKKDVKTVLQKDGSTPESVQEELESRGWQKSYSLVIVLNIVYILIFLWLTITFSESL